MWKQALACIVSGTYLRITDRVFSLLVLMTTGNPLQN